MKKIKTVARLFVFFALLLCLLGGLDRLLMRKENITAMKPFLDRAKEHDVLFLGDSTIRAGVFPLELYHKYGITSYNISSNNSRIPMTYWRMINAFDYVTPKVVVFSVVDIEWPQLTYDKGERMHEAFNGFPMTLNKVRAIMELMDQEGNDKSGVPFSDIRTELFFPLRKYHARWSSLEEEDFHPVYNQQKGAVPIVHVSDPDVKAKLAGAEECLPEEGYGYVYLRKAIEACKERNIPIVLFVPPYPIRPEAHMGTHTAAKIAEEYGVPMLNFVDMDRVVDYYTDCSDPGGHLNPSGGKKVTDYLGRYLTDHYDLPDRRNDPAYAHWNDEYDAYVDEKIRMIKEDANSLRARLMLLHDESFNVVLTARPGFDFDAPGVKAALQNIARLHVYEDDAEVSAELEPLYGLGDAADFGEGYMMIVDRDVGDEYESVHEFYGIGEQEFETSFGYVFCRMDGEWIDLSITQGDEEVYYFDSWEEQDEDMHLILIDRRTGKPALVMAFSQGE